jgi:hypothetical protein
MYPQHDERANARLEMIATIMMAVATIATAWCAYQSTLWGGVEEDQLHDADELNRQALALRAQGTQLSMLDVHIFTNFANAYALGQTRLADFYRDRFSPRLKPAFTAWIEARERDSLHAPKHPFEMKEYVVPQNVRADSLLVQYREGVRTSRTSGGHSEDFVMLTVVYASILFFGGISSNLDSIGTKRIFVIGSAVLLAISVVWMFTFPLAP